MSSAKQPANAVVIACNGLHLGFLGAYGNAWIETPNLDQLAAEGIVFDQHFADNLTTIPTRRSWWTGRYGFADPDQAWTALRPDERILPDLLWDQGVRTALISDNPFLREKGSGFGRGFDDVCWIRGSGYDPYVTVEQAGPSVPRVEDEPGLPLPEVDDPDRDLWLKRWSAYLRNRSLLRLSTAVDCTNVARTLDAAVSWLEQRPDGGQPFLLWIDLFAPHGPWDPPQPFRDMYVTVEPDEFEIDDEGELADTMLDGQSGSTAEDARVLIDVPPGIVGEVLSGAELLRLRRMYAGCVTLLDKQLGTLFEAMRRLGRTEDTMLVFTADQGEPLGEHGYVRRFRPWLYEELTHTPLIIRLPKYECAGLRHQALVQPVDLLPTILGAVGAIPPHDPALHGHDLVPLIRGERTKLREYACMGMDVEEFALRTHNWHLVLPVKPDPDDPERSVELFRKPEDRWDQNNVAEQHPDVADQLELALRRFAQASLRDAIDELPPLRDVARFAGEL